MAQQQRATRRAPLSQSRTRLLGMDVPTEASAVASVAQEHGAAGASLGPLGTRQGASDQRLRQRPSTATHLLLLSAAGPCGAWRSRSLRTQDDAGGVVAPSLRPPKAGDRVHTDRRDAVPLARLARAGALPPVDGPPVDAAAIRALTRARAEAISDRTEAPGRRKAGGLRQARRAAGRAHGGPAHLRWRAAVVWPPPAQPLGLHADVRAVTEHTVRLGRVDQARRAQGTTWRWPPVVDARQAVRGVPCPVAVTLGAAMGHGTRFEPPSARRPWLGGVPSA